MRLSVERWRVVVGGLAAQPGDPQSVPSWRTVHFRTERAAAGYASWAHANGASTIRVWEGDQLTVDWRRAAA